MHLNPLNQSGSAQPYLLPMHSPNHREVLECGGWRGTGLTPLWSSHGMAGQSGVCPRPSPTALQDAGARHEQLRGSTREAFSLIELIGVMAIIAFLAVIVFTMTLRQLD